MLNKVLLDAATKVINNPAPANFTLLAHFISAKEGSSFSFYPLIIDGMNIDRNYADNFTDAIDLMMKISPLDYALMMDQGQYLRCVVTITYTDKYGKQLFEPAPLQRQYHAIINDPRDIRKSVPNVESYTQPSIEMSVRLVEPTVYALRHTKINRTYQTMTVEHVIYDITQSFDIKYIHLITPDNTHVHDHVTIASFQGIDSVYNYLQSMCGVYEKGINAYITDEVLYVYPPFETDPTYDKSVILYQVDRHRFQGNNSFHMVDDTGMSLVVNTQPESQDQSITGAENVGTGFVFTRASRMTDGYTTIDSAEGAKFTEQATMTISLSPDGSNVGSTSNLVHIKATDNPYPMMSELASHQASLMQIKWPFADPFQIDPCQKLLYYYDRNDVMYKKTGILERARYVMTRGQRTGEKDLFKCDGLLELRLSPNENYMG